MVKEGEPITTRNVGVSFASSPIHNRERHQLQHEALYFPLSIQKPVGAVFITSDVPNDPRWMNAAPAHTFPNQGENITFTASPRRISPVQAKSHHQSRPQSL